PVHLLCPDLAAPICRGGGGRAWWRRRQGCRPYRARHHDRMPAARPGPAAGRHAARRQPGGGLAMASFVANGSHNTNMSALEKLRHFNWGLLLLISATAAIGFAMLYSAGNGKADPWMTRQAFRFAGGFV